MWFRMINPKGMANRAVLLLLMLAIFFSISVTAYGTPEYDEIDVVDEETERAIEEVLQKHIDRVSGGDPREFGKDGYGLIVPIDFASLYREIAKIAGHGELEELDELEEHEELGEPSGFTGPCGAVLWEEGTLAVILPTEEESDEAEEEFASFVRTLKRFEGAEIITDREALERDLSEYNIVAFGSMEGNLWIKRHVGIFPFMVEKDMIYAGREYKAENPCIITCLPNPRNDTKGLLLYIGQSIGDLPRMMRIVHGITDFLIVDDYGIIFSGNYVKEDGGWKFVQLPELTVSQMEADFLAFQNALENSYPWLYLAERAFGNGSMDELDNARSKVKSGVITDTLEFVQLIGELINLCQDEGLYMARGDDSILNFQVILDPYIGSRHRALSPEMDVLQQYASIYSYYAGNGHAKGIKKLETDLPIRYLAGEYYVIREFEFKGRGFERGLKLVECNGIDIHRLVGGLVREARLDWDVGRKRFYCDRFYELPSIRAMESVDLTFEDRDGGRFTETLKFVRDVGAEILNPFILPFDDAVYISIQNIVNELLPDDKETPEEGKPENVRYFEDEKILYIKLPALKSQILSVAKGKDIGKIVIDVRGTLDIDDDDEKISKWDFERQFGYNLPIMYLMNEPLAVNVRLLFPKDEDPYLFVNAVERVDFLWGMTFLMNGEIEVIDNFKESLDYAGDIYILQDETTGAANEYVTRLARETERLISVGSRIKSSRGRMLENPECVNLQNSRVIVCFQPVLDYTEVDELDDFFHNWVDVPVELDIDYYLERGAYEGDLTSYEYLVNHDPLFKKVLEL